MKQAEPFRIEVAPRTREGLLAGAHLAAINDIEVLTEQLDAAREDRKVLEEKLEEVARIVGMKPDDGHDIASAVDAAIRTARANPDKAISLGEKRLEKSLMQLAVERRARLMRFSDELIALVARFKGSAAHEQLCTALERVAKEAVDEKEITRG